MSYNDLPRHLQLHIMSLLDIDSRRAIGVYSRLTVPKNIENLLCNIPRIKQLNQYTCYVNLCYRKTLYLYTLLIRNRIKYITVFTSKFEDSDVLKYYKIFTQIDF